MSTTINYGIDLGTTNSLIAKCEHGVVEVFKNPVGLKETLPSVVGFRKERILVGDKAREYIEKDPANVFAGFKRKMGTSESFFVPGISDFKTPVQLSSMVLNELRNFIYNGESPKSVVITIPASFDTVQSNATKQAGYDAGFTEVVLLQEPIAASLAFVNKGKEDTKEGKWLVYDLGGGTFDVALVSIRNGEMSVTDHEGNNYLGGLDFDNLIIDELIIPYVQTKGSFTDLSTSMKSASGKHNKLYYELLYKAEEAKILLSATHEADIEFELEDDNGDDVEIVFTLTRDAFNSVIKARIDETIRFTQTIVERNNLSAGDIKEVILIGGSTYIPYVRNTLHEQLGIAVNASVDPTTAVAIGAAWYASTRSAAQPVKENTEANDSNIDIEVKMAYQKNTNERDEYFSAMVKGNITGKYYRITRDDGGFDSGLKPLAERIEEVLSLLPDTLNLFAMKLYDEQQQPIAYTLPAIQIVHGKFSIYGQPLPNDICLEVDDVTNNTTGLELIFEKNAILPLKKTVTKTISRTIVKGSTEQLVINVLEGSRYATPQSNLPIGVIAIQGKDLQQDLIKGSDVDLTFEVTESRDIKISAYINISDQEYAEVFSPTSRSFNIERMKEEVDYLLRQANKNIQELVDAEDYEGSARLQETVTQLEHMQKRLRLISHDDVTDEKYQLEEQKRKLAFTVENLGRDNRIRKLKEEYYDWKDAVQQFITEAKNEVMQKRLDQLAANETAFLNGSEAAVKRKIDDLRNIHWELRRKDLNFIAGVYLYYAMKEESEYSDIKRFRMLKERGDGALERKSVEELLSIIHQMYALLIDKEYDEPMKGTGLS